MARTPSLRSVNLSAIVAQLASAVARYANTGRLEFDNLSDGSVNVVTCDRRDGAVIEGEDCLYIPCITGSMFYAWEAYVGAALGVGSAVIVDNCATNQYGAPMSMTPNNELLAAGCRQALLLIAGMYQWRVCVCGPQL